jgi:hypothetical protein
MAKTKTPVAKPAPAAAPAKVAAPAAKTVVLQVVKQPAKTFRAGSARALYWERVQAHNGNPVAALANDIAVNPPSTPTKGKLAGQVEPLTGWLSWFKAQGLITIG